MAVPQTRIHERANGCSIFVRLMERASRAQDSWVLSHFIDATYANVAIETSTKLETMIPCQNVSRIKVSASFQATKSRSLSLLKNFHP